MGGASSISISTLLLVTLGGMATTLHTLALIVFCGGTMIGLHNKAMFISYFKKKEGRSSCTPDASIVSGTPPSLG